MKITCYAHGGSYNHGCEAIVRATNKILQTTNCINKIELYSFKKQEDEEFGLNQLCDIIQTGYFNKKVTLNTIYNSLKYKLLNDSSGLYYLQNDRLLSTKNKVALSIGGDNYCYDDRSSLYYINHQLTEKKIKTVLWGCSIEPGNMNDEMIEDLRRYELVTARETITYNALLKNGINKNTKLYPDPAFQLDRIDLPLPSGFAEGNTIGINISPLIMKYEIVNGATFRNYAALLKHIIDTTKLQIALIPHVTWATSNDLEPLGKLYEQFKDTNRVILINGHYNCMQIKGFIARCRFFIGARTHATIAAYSTCVPTLVVGYSVKALGIARDIFGSEKNMVIPVQYLENKNDLIKAFEYIANNQQGIKRHLKRFIPAYIEKAAMAGLEINKIMHGLGEAT